MSQFRSPHAVLLLFTSPLLHSAPHPAHHLPSITLAQWKIARFSTTPGLIPFCLSLRLWGDFLLCRDGEGSYDPASDSLVNRDSLISLLSVWIFACWTLPRHLCCKRHPSPHQLHLDAVCGVIGSVYGFQAPLFLPWRREPPAPPSRPLFTSVTTPEPAQKTPSCFQ